MNSSVLRRTVLIIAVAAFLAGIGAPARAEVEPNSLFSDGAVLQQGVAVPVWGAGKDGEQITVKIQDQTVSTTVRDGRWLVRLKSMKAGGPFTMTITGDNTITITNVLVGEVWLCSGQSNMAFHLAQAANAAEAIAVAGDFQLRLFTVPYGATDTPKAEVPGSWKESSPETARNFSAVAWFFGRELRWRLKVPVGLIHSSVGGTPAEAWTSRATLEADPDLKATLERYAEQVKKYDPVAAAAQHERALEKHKQAVEKAQAAGEKTPPAPRAPADPRQASVRPCGLYNAMIAPLEPYAIAGAIWYQGESNAGRATEYQKLFPAMIQNWRQAWGQGEFPFLFVQIAPHQAMKPEIREAQLLSWQKVPRTAMAVITDIGDEKDIHPTKKEPVGARLALAARAIAYGEHIEYSGPVYASMKIEGILNCHDIGSPLLEKDGELKRFTIAGADGSFVAAKAVIEGDKIVVSSPEVPKPVAARYGWVNIKIEGERAILNFTHIGSGLMAKDGELKGFTIAGADGSFVAAKAVIEGDKIVVSSPEVPKPAAVRYGWANTPDVNLFNKEGLPATPFRTDVK